MQTNIILCGVGGQGIVLTSKLIAAAAMARGIPVMSAETIGMAQKGGSVFSFLRLGDGLRCPMFPPQTADLLIGFEPAEAVRMFPYLKPEGRAVVNTHAVMPVTAALAGSDYTGREMLAYLRENCHALTALDADAGCRVLGSAKVLNMIMLGAAIRAGVLPFTAEEMEETMRRTVKPQFAALNARALSFRPYSFYGWEWANVPPLPEAKQDYPGISSPYALYDALLDIWSRESCAPRLRGKWSPENPTLGQCSITAFLAQDIFGGKVLGVPRPGGTFHCCNLVGGRLFDLTSEQFGDEVLRYENLPEQTREVHFAQEEKRLRYEALSAALKAKLKD